ncbi:hypothetical protein ACERZ8_00055 [Tateyamaria armeniaca]|uniref:Mannosyltransferase n=1 Tax=Tateyamaria armeniaca TaxID=2518930 RepID=A0ABW8UN94_9RHOB
MSVMTHFFPPPASMGTGRETAVTWRFFWPVLLVGFALRLVFAQWADLPLHPDETYQYYEQAYRLVHGYGLIPWEYVFGIRSWLIPLCLAGLLVVADVLGLDQPHEYAFFLKTVLCLISLSLPIAMYRLTQVLWSEQAAILSLLLGCFWHHFLYVAHKPMPGILAMYGLLWLVLWMVRPQTRARVFAFGLMLGLVFTLRYQLVPVLGLLWLIALYRLRAGALGLMLLGNALALALAGGLDWIFWGGFLSSFIDNFRLNFLYDIASNFGEQEVLFYAKRLIVESGGLFVIGLIGVALLWGRIWPVAVAMAIGVLAFHIPAHKELRFVLWIMPLALIGAVLASWLGLRGARGSVAAPVFAVPLGRGGDSRVFGALSRGCAVANPLAGRGGGDARAGADGGCDRGCVQHTVFAVVAHAGLLRLGQTCAAVPLGLGPGSGAGHATGALFSYRHRGGRRGPRRLQPDQPSWHLYLVAKRDAQGRSRP